MNNKHLVFDPSILNDDIANKTGWHPVKGGGAGGRTHRLVIVNSGRLEFRATIIGVLLPLIFFLVGLVMLIGFPLYDSSFGKFLFAIETIGPIVLGGLFCGAGGGILYLFTTKTVFDKPKGAFWKNRRGFNRKGNFETQRQYVEFDDIYALQIIPELVSVDIKTPAFYSYELNVVLKSGKRVNVIDHGDLQKLRDDTITLSEFLGRPVWDAVVK